jgi:hypothetical protein
MRNLKVCILLLGILLFLASTTWGVLISDVGSIDPLVSAANISSSAQSEADWLNSLLGTNYDSNYIDANKIQADSTTWEPVVGGAVGQYAFQLPSNEQFFLVKTGNGSFDHWLFQNVDSTIWGTVLVGGFYPLNGTGIFFNINDIESISHIVPAATSVPEPSGLLLLGAGLIGLISFRRQKSMK